ncbi:terminase small subunit [Ligilactobacillus cholophilus]|uniref:terminase small subunit n=1 Tax=Ligilactobacillus cholophilus TaxID=3050131 RepID=UPI0025B0DDF0|nr:terminase small subunit [Ligilactobacillus cholophilus]
MKLTHKQQMFADEYLKSGNATDAYIKAGYKVKNSSARSNASRMLTNANIKSYIDKKLAEIESHKIADAKEIMEFYSSVLRGEAKETVVISTPFGMKKTEKEPDIKTRLSAGKELMKRYPADDPLTKQQLRKLNADAELLEMKVDALKGGKDAITQIIFSDDMKPDEDEERENNGNEA